MTPPKGHYKQILSNHFPEIRIAFTHTPIYGCTIVNSDNVLKVLDASDDQYSSFYANGLRSGSLVTIVENGYEHAYKNNGELYFTT